MFNNGRLKMKKKMEHETGAGFQRCIGAFCDSNGC